MSTEPARVYTKAESKLVYEWLKKTHPKALQWRRVRVGPLEQNNPLYGVLRRWADIIFLDENVVHIVEAKIRPEPGAIMQLKLYSSLFPRTPEFYSVRNNKIEMIFLCATYDAAVEKLCQENDVQFVVFTPDWAKEYIRQTIARLPPGSG